MMTVSAICPQREYQWTKQADGVKEGLKKYNDIYISSILKLRWWCGSCSRKSIHSFLFHSFLRPKRMYI